MNITRFFIWLIVALILASEAISARCGLPTISACVRGADLFTGGLLRWVLLAFWFHWFFSRPWGGW